MNEKTGRCAILFPHGVLFRDEERDMRIKLIQEDILDSIIGLGPNLFFNASMEACIVICNKNKPSERINKVLFINAQEEVTRRNAESYLESSHIKKIAEAYKSFHEIEGFSSIVSSDVLLDKDANLNIAAHVIKDAICSVKPFEVSFSEWAEISKLAKEQVENLLNLLQ